MIRKTVAITIFTASMFAVGCSSSDDDGGLPSNDEIAPIGISDTGDDGTTDDTSDLDGAGAEPVVPPVTPAPDVPGEDDAATDDATPVVPSDDTETAEGDTSDPDAGVVPPPPPGGTGDPGSEDGSDPADSDTDDDAIEEDTDSSTGDEPALTAALGELDGNPESSRALITRQLLAGTEFGTLLDGSEQPFTLFVPTDAAFISLGMSLEQLLDDPELANTLQFHLVQGEALDRVTLNERSGQDLTMANGQSSPLVQNGENVQIGSATISDAPDGGRVRNGVFYLIDQVLIPATGE